MTNAKMKPMVEPEGVYDVKIEGFADVGDSDNSGESSTSTPALKNTENAIADNVVNDVTNALTDKKEEEVEEFKSATNELFKLGKMPSEHSEGPMLDAGSTLLKAMGSFKPEQINAMSNDTKQLLETQKSLMGMLTQMRPVLADGKELLNTFSGMFGNGAMKM
jgi:hypothetical protein